MRPVAALDIGTTTARAGIFDDDGRRLAVARTTLATSHPLPGAVEQDPEEYVRAAVALLRHALDEAGMVATDLGGLGIANQRATVVAWDAGSGRPLAPAVGWQDTRTRDRCAELRAQGIPLTTSASCSKLEWLVATHPAVAAAAASGSLRLGTVDTWLTWALSGGEVHATDPSNAGATGLYDLRTGDWSDGALELFGVPRAPLADVIGSDEPLGTTAMDLLGATIPFLSRIGDQQAACAAHALEPGAAKLTLGTSAMLDISLGPTATEAPTGCYTLPLWRRQGRDEFMVEGSVQTAGAVMEWLVRIGVLPSVDRIDEMAAAASDTIGFVPALAGLGTPDQDPDARGAMTGLGLDSGSPEIVRGALAGIAQRVADVTATVGVAESVRIDGGLSRSLLLRQLIADATGLVVRAATDPETTLRGAAILAMAGAEPGPAPLDDPVTPTVTDTVRAEARALHRRRTAVARDTYRSTEDGARS